MTTVAYLVNQYPKVSHSFIRREILALEAQGVNICRYSIRPCPDQLVDPDDLAELDKTQVLLSVGVLGLGLAFIEVMFSRPLAFVKALGLAIQIGWHSDRGLGRHFIYLAEASVLLFWLGEAGVDHVHAHFGTNPAAVAMLCHALGGPSYSFTVHGPDEFDKPQMLHLATKVAHAKFVVAVSSFGKSQLYRWSHPQHWPKIHIVHCGLDRLFLDQPQIALPEAPQIVCIGRLCPAKGQLLLVEAVSQLVQEGIALTLTLVGDGESRTAIESAIATAQLEEVITITGWVGSSHIRDYLLKAKVKVLPSFAEGLPVVLMEALALGRPVISTYIAGIPELVDPKNGWLIPAGSISALKEAIRVSLATSTAQLLEMGQVGADRVRAEHNIETEVMKLSRRCCMNRSLLGGGFSDPDCPKWIKIEDSPQL
ncbi:glycosyltransferase [Acaryochloris sp. IP29b_bin.137]|uniref:glycosyltransferase n=1 Tax=Acaryochloris sp. IP29b_bin.137 TaxID=2969217 RepID=UPI00262974FF|nr:glycosyltransferase [Acaryochloris sp. IP29b_bin.137]